eukprot:10273765-Ditylum_brightwellii.AAC.1
MRANAAFAYCNAKACYNRIVAIIASLVEYKAGLPADACILLAKVLKQMEYTMVTAYGPSVLKNKHGPGNPLHGIGQGLMDVPAWCNFGTDICMKCYDQLAHGFHNTDPIQTTVLQQNTKQFVGDNKLAHNGGRCTAPVQELMIRVKEGMAAWYSILDTAGRLLELKKTAYALLIWQFKENGEPVIKQESELPVNN